ncbi:MAG: hypothetical protein U0794_19200 [Isosphaeraceae bacterium]
MRLASTRRADATRAVETLLDLGAPLLGAVINDAAPDRRPSTASLLQRALSGGEEPANPFRHAATIRHDPQVALGQGLASLDPAAGGSQDGPTGKTTIGLASMGGAPCGL